ncbi:conserved hypothetical protein [Thiobacillus denitrificans ATCC 25259]|uniref:PepSY domain-containing protein n=1 Tax=Thiobacillus denitrificans (strain ATCC 25259 / T1) TaxID=292415 RepID=Q3SKV5_THIDA|nr:PepSY-associated TM helix domain-containing protein [Thiobacillus denitrificans]AAZ96667.1 conserved hypothetical protein [Thiobacillus denitrificans ATCC 25259]
MTARRLVVKLHLYTGLFVGLLLAVTGLSGSVLVFREELEALAHQHLLVSDGSGERVAVADVVAAVQRAYPADKPFAIRVPRAPQETYLVKLNNAHDRFVYVDPYDGSILGTHRQRETVLGWLALLHTELLAGEAGETVVGVGGLLLLGLGATGVVLWWPRNGKLSQGFKMQWSAHWKRLNFDLHRATGIYAVLFLSITAATGAAFVFNASAIDLVDALTASAPRPPAPRLPPDRPGAPAPTLDALLQAADRALPLPTTWVSLPQTASAPLVVRKKRPDEPHPNGRNFVFLDPRSGAVLQLERDLLAPRGTRVFNTLYPLHVGAIAGTPTRILQAAVGLAPLVLMVTGLAMWANRRRRKRPPR